IARVEDQIGEGFGQRATGKLRQTRIQPLVHRADRGRRKLWPHSSSVIAFTPAFARAGFCGSKPLAHTSPPAPPPAPAPSADSVRIDRSRTARFDPAAPAAPAGRPA